MQLFTKAMVGEKEVTWQGGAHVNISPTNRRGRMERRRQDTQFNDAVKQPEGGCDGGDEIADNLAETSRAFGFPSRRDTCLRKWMDPVKNYIDYTDDSCMDTFTDG